MLKLLPDGVMPFIFPPITVKPDEFVSNSLLTAIRACDGLIYLEGGYSEQSFWVALERDYGLRLGKPVFAFSTPEKHFRKLKDTALNMPVFYIDTHSDRDESQQIWRFMITERFFTNCWDEEEWARVIPGGKEYEEKYIKNVIGCLEKGSYMVAFLAPPSYTWIEPVFNWVHSSGFAHRVVFARLGNLDLPARYEHHPKHLCVDLFTDGELSMVNRTDNLIVCLYWLIYQETRHNKLD